MAAEPMGDESILEKAANKVREVVGKVVGREDLTQDPEEQTSDPRLSGESADQ